MLNFCSLVIDGYSLFFFRFIYTGSVDVNLDIAQDLLRAADQYLLDGLKRLCEHAIALVSSEINFLIVALK